MPELPEVETVANGLNDRIRGENIDSAWLGSNPQTFKTPPAKMAAQLTGRTIERVYRVGKHIVFDLDVPAEDRESTAPIQWIVHLGMTGRLLISAPEIPVPPHTHVILSLGSGRELRFVDPRRFGRLSIHLLNAVVDGDKGPGRFQGPGREPLSISLADFIRLFRGRRTPIKAALLNQKLLHGVGNIYADESLFRAEIRPRRMAGRLRRGELERLHSALQSVLRAAIDLGGSSVSDYVDANGMQGFFQMEHRVYMRTGQPCQVCGSPIRRIVLAGRGTHFCATCQR